MNKPVGEYAPPYTTHYNPVKHWTDEGGQQPFRSLGFMGFGLWGARRLDPSDNCRAVRRRGRHAWAVTHTEVRLRQHGLMGFLTQPPHSASDAYNRNAEGSPAGAAAAMTRGAQLSILCMAASALAAVLSAQSGYVITGSALMLFPVAAGHASLLLASTRRFTTGTFLADLAVCCTFILERVAWGLA